MPTPKQMEKLAAEAARRPGPLRCGSGCSPPGGILGIGPQRPSRRCDRSPAAAATSFRDSAPRAAHLLPPLRADRRNPDRRCSPIVWRQRGLEGRRAASARQHLPAAHRKTRRRRVLAGVRDAVARSGSPIRSFFAWMSGWHRSITLRPCRAAIARLWRKNSARHARWPTSWRPIGRDAGQGRGDDPASRQTCFAKAGTSGCGATANRSIRRPPSTRP